MSAYSAAVMALSPLAYYRMNDAPGATSLSDSSGNGYDMPIINPGHWDFQQPSLLPNGDTDYSISMAGGNTYGQLSHNFGGGQKTIVLICKPTAPTGLCSSDGLGVAGCGATASVHYPPADTFTYSIHTGAEGYDSPNSSHGFVVGNTYFIAILNGPVSYQYLSINGGNFVNLGYVGAGQYTNDGKLLIGLSGNQTISYGQQWVYGNGGIDEVAVFAGHLTQSQVSNLAAVAGFVSSNTVSLSATGRIKAKAFISLPATARIGANGSDHLNASARIMGGGKKSLAGSGVIAAGLPYVVNATAVIQASASLSLNASARIGMPAVVVTLGASASIGNASSLSLGASASIAAPTVNVSLNATARVSGHTLVGLTGTATIVTANYLAWVDRKLKVTPIFRDSYATLAKRDRP